MLTETQKEILEFIRTSKRSPTYNEIAEGVGVAVRAIQYQLDKMECAGVVSRDRSGFGRVLPRTVKIVGQKETA